jgi:hypothetical protein
LRDSLQWPGPLNSQLLQTPFNNCHQRRKRVLATQIRCSATSSVALQTVLFRRSTFYRVTITSAEKGPKLHSYLVWVGNLDIRLCTCNWDQGRAVYDWWDRSLCVNSDKCWVSPTGHLLVYGIIQFHDWIGLTKPPRASESIFNRKKIGSFPRIYEMLLAEI